MPKDLLRLPTVQVPEEVHTNLTPEQFAEIMQFKLAHKFNYGDRLVIRGWATGEGAEFTVTLDGGDISEHPELIAAVQEFFENPDLTRFEA